MSVKIDVSGHKAMIYNIRGHLADAFLCIDNDRIEVRLGFLELVEGIGGFLINLDLALFGDDFPNADALLLLIQHKAEQELERMLRDDKEGAAAVAERAVRANNLDKTAARLKELLGV